MLGDMDGNLGPAPWCRVCTVSQTQTHEGRQGGGGGGGDRDKQQQKWRGRQWWSGRQAGRQMRGRSETPRCWLGTMHALSRRIEIEVIKRKESRRRSEQGARHGATEHQA